VARQLDLFDDRPSTGRPAPKRVARGRPQVRRDALTAASKTPADAVTSFLDHLAASGRARHSLTSIRLDLLQFSRFIQPSNPGRPTLRQLRAFVQWLSSERGNGVSSLRRKIATLKAYSRFLHHNGYITTDVAARLAYPRAHIRPPGALADAESQRLLQAAAEHSPLWTAIVALLLETGIKRDELLALQRADLVLDPESPRDSFLRLRRRHQAERTRLRTVPVSEALFLVMRDYLASIPIRQARLFPLTPRGVDFVVETCGARAAIDSTGKTTPQRLRDSYAIRLLATFVAAEDALATAGADEPGLQQLRAAHDAELLRLLGLSPDSSAVQRYRRAIERSEQPEVAER
jgi:site-specific recombinase XerD